MRRPQSSESVPLKTLLVVCVFLKVSKVESECTVCKYKVGNITTTEVTINDTGNCTTGNNSIISGEDFIVKNLLPGATHSLTIECEGKCCINFTTKPDDIVNLSVTKTTTSSVSLSWNKAQGNISFYKVEWYAGGQTWNTTTLQASVDITGLKAATQYTFKIVAVADDEETEGKSDSKTQYTRPGIIKNLSVTQITTSSVYLSWTQPQGQISIYRVAWNDNSVKKNNTTNQLFMDISGLTAGTQYVFSVTAVAADNQTAGEPVNETRYTRPDVIENFTVTQITKSSVELSWAEPQRQFSIYRVEWNDNTVQMSKTINQPSLRISNLTAGTQYVFSVTAVAADNQTTGEPVNETRYTSPDVVKNLSVGQITTSSVSLNWTAPEGQSLFYRIEWKDNSGPNNITTNRTSVDISGLTAGTQYVFSVTAIAADNQTAGESANETQYTKPEKVVKMIAWQIGNSSLTFSWNLSGSASSYEVSLSSDIKNTSTTKEISFSDLEAGIIYNVTVISIAGPFKNTSDTFQFATKPNPPEVNNTKTTNESISLTWYTPHLSEGVTGISYIITYFHQGSNTQKNVSGTMTELSSLAPGERYNISLQTVGPQDLSSNAVFCIAYTLPNPISNLKASPESIMSVRLEWTQSTGNQQLLSYRVSSSSDPGNFNTTQTNYSSIVGLQPGTKYNFTVIPVIADNIGGPAQYIFGYTKPKKVDGLNATAINKTAIVVTWTRQDDYKTSYSYLVSISTEDSLIQNKTTANESIYFNNLTAGTHYTCKVITNVNNVQSDETTTKVLTKPEGASDVRAIGTTTNMTVTWKGPSGISSSYNIKIFNSSDTLIDNQTVKSNQSVKFLSLRPGQVYTVKVIILSGPFQEESGTVKNATFPNPPRNIKVLDQTTTSISISWELPLNMVHGQYNFTVFQNSKLPITTDNTQQDITNLTSGKQYNISVATVGPKGYLSTPVTVTTTTRPLSVSQLQGLDITTSGLTLTWGQPEPQQGYSYFIMVQYPNGTLANQTTSNTSVSIEGLQSGSNHTFTVTTQTADGTAASLESLLSLFTRPFPIRNLTAVTLNTTTIFLNWSKPQEFQENFFYGVETTGFNFAMNQSENSESAYVTGLKSGSNYSFMVYSKAANGIEGEPISTSQYTMPNKPGHITIKNRTTNSIFLNWGGASGTGTGSFSYRISYQSTLSNAITKDTPSTEVSLTGLESGTPYNISVTTVGPMNFTSEAVFIHLVTTKPESVRSLNVSSTFQYQIDLQWEAPTDKKFEYRYRVMAPNNENITKETNETSYQLKNLYPGTNYTFSVTTLAFDRTEGNQKSINVCTDMAPVSNLTCVGPDRENPILTLKWTEPRGENQEFWVQSNKTSLDDLEKVKSCCSHNLTNLSYNRMYEVKVWTLGCGKNTSVTEVCMTGITAPDVPNLTYVTITGKEHDKFTLQLNPSLFNDTKCPIVNYSVLVTSAEQSVHDEGQSSLHKYLNKTYDDWKKGSTSTYLAVIKAAENLNRNTGNSPLHVVIGDGTKSNLYNNGPLKASGSYSFALVTFTRLDLLNNGLVSVENSIFSISSISPESINLPVNPVVIGGAVGGTIAALVILVIAVIIAVVIFKRWSKGESSEVPIYSIRAKVSVPIRVEDYEAYYREQRADSNCGFAEQFEDLKPVGVAQAKNAALAPENKAKNRYNNVLPYDSSRVKLSVHGSPYDDYINASYMPGYNNRKEFIAAQGPLPGTVNDFWRMIWEKNVHTLVMLTRCNEQGRVKCEEYWPSGSQHYNNITVTTTSEIPLEDWTIRDFSIKNVKTAETRSLRHFHFTAWPDHGVPETTELLINFRHLVREHMDQYSRNSPTIVHCSAGVGRTGTFIAIDRLIFQIERDSAVDVFGVIHELRMHRPLMVQTEDQYVFLNQCAMDIIRSRTGTNVDLIYQNTAALSIYENFEPMKKSKNGYHNA